ncbi:MAG: ATP-dependent DNA helicase [Actinomycetota bacterium]
MSTYPEEIRRVMNGDPTPEQWAAISAPAEPFVIVAGAGSGKTSVMAARVVYLALAALGRIDAGHQGVLPGNVLCLTFTNKATEHLTLKIRHALSGVDLPEGEEPEVLNYHGFAEQILERHGLLAGIEPDRRILSPAQRTELAARVLDKMAFEFARSEWQPSLIDNILSLADQAANHRVSPDEIISFNEERLQALKAHRSDRAYNASLERIELARAVKLFEELKREKGVIDFGDQISLALDVVEKFPQVGEEYRSRFETVLLDEYQDTNVTQARLIEEVFGGGFPVTAVGDPDQNIYAWRGASLYNLLEFPRQFPRANGEPAAKLPLYTNFRSGARILAAADRIIEPLPAAQRPDPDKRLVPWDSNGEGAVAMVRHASEWDEANWIAERILELHGDDTPWATFAVLCRKSRLFVPLQEAFAEHGIPVEIVGLAGLLSLPEVVEVLAYARAVADPFAGVSLARILLGPRYRVGFKDLARVAAWAKDKNYTLRDEDEGESHPFLFAEALEHLPEVEGLSEEGRARLEEFRTELEMLRDKARKPVGEFLAEVIRRSGLLTELDASPDPEVAAATKRNLAAFIDEVHAFSPIDGELTLRAFLDYVETVEQSERPEWSPVQPSDDDSVKVMTIHVAKGLEFATVFVPGFADKLLPDPTIQHNPAERGKSMDFELRGDAAILPAFKGVLKAFKEELKEQEFIEERRTCYVGLTRAKQRLFVSGAHWYGDGMFPKKPSLFFDELADWADETGRATAERGPDEPGDENPLLGYRERFVRDWPGPALQNEPDPLFAGGWRRAAADSAGLGGLQPELVQTLPEEERGAFEHLTSERQTLAAHLIEREREADPGVRAPTTASASTIRDYLECPKKFYWKVVRPLPTFSGPAARIGTEVHAWIESQATGQSTLIDLDETPDLTDEELAGEPGKVEKLKESFRESRFAGRVPLFAERAFLLNLDGFVIGGRIDAIYGEAEGPWEIVDYKTGRVPKDDPLSWLQLDVYALACMEVWRKKAEELTLTYLYLGEPTEVSRAADGREEIRSRVVEALSGIAGGKFDPTPGAFCKWCDFLPFCDAGKAFVGK